MSEQPKTPAEPKFCPICGVAVGADDLDMWSETEQRSRSRFLRTFHHDITCPACGEERDVVSEVRITTDE